MSNVYHHRLGHGQKCALLVSDMQRAYTEGLFDPNFSQDQEIEKIQNLLSIAYQNNISVIFTIIAFNTYEITHPNIWLQKIPQLRKLHENSMEASLDPRLEFNIEKANLIVKKHTSSFFDTPLANQLNSEQIDTLIMTGCTTSGCVRATVVEGLEHGFRMLVVRDAVADRWPESHERSLFEINAKYGDVIDSTEAISLMKKL